MAVGAWGARNAAVLAAQILAVSDEALRARLAAWKAGMARKIEAASGFGSEVTR
jgi:phosphoribosylcarboxyaminoimidazole (NCAIR) mutase